MDEFHQLNGLFFVIKGQIIECAFPKDELIAVIVGVKVNTVLVMLWNGIGIGELVVSVFVSDLCEPNILAQMLFSELLSDELPQTATLFHRHYYFKCQRESP